LKFELLGNLHSYKFTGMTDANHGLLDADSDLREISNERPSFGLDWALVRVQPVAYMRNISMDPDLHRPVSIDGHLCNDELFQGNVLVCSGTKGVISGFLNTTEGSVMIESSVFSVRSIMLDEELGS
jgi:hypothetical protein